MFIFCGVERIIMCICLRQTVHIILKNQQNTKIHLKFGSRETSFKHNHRDKVTDIHKYYSSCSKYFH